MPVNLGEALALARGRIDNVDARILLREATGATAAQILAFPERGIAPEAARRFCDWLARRVAGEPVAHLLGGREFYGRPFRVVPATLIPRPETELLVELALDRLQSTQAPQILDLGTGSGAIAVSLALERPDAAVCAIDYSPEALEFAQHNALALGACVDFRLGSWYAPVSERRFDLIASNPPYIAENDPHLGQGDLRFEPLTALASGPDGLNDLRHIVAQAATHLLPGRWLLLEHGYDQAEAVRLMLETAGFRAVASWRDLAGIERVSGGHL
ncbi:MAG: protein-(glutamine-N5) methyltransferase, release factor-specific [Candidatus Dactylopiibacterium carminicum]|uniref:Release factor glutamine methyltransferase n=1 Tax=Candidatus Dactylopiibacterium carminicum TaxID=857335 RepID=A0A272EQF1_9RHOO|nr:peptide chain release factor N(5)-glutamine methyltransferase [Candidatus Dactylopiibacterium carminicum]PAS92339.1 MAG: protein-(glutamine-N5) methyltransferase, release factor-specific [Candidatus Dactylopiibacterium carminicum]PAS95922.1 MAG: protein-(glutamine-N5) methyltransferase, release factor-specific [Candidatus Dactylopiibacterium carminicum]PAS98122.1 MAG: protein-(glutamine-N5) methyltransferase, release factor-specific [Candidatus Dactylopiibacterium carminicum]